MEYKLKSQAVDFRNRFGYNSSEPINFLSLLQRIDILTIFKPLSDDFSGLSIKIDSNRFILVNSNQSVGRQNFTIGHEIYHLFYDDNFIPHKCKTGQFPRKNNSEKFADIFASHLLLPENGVIGLIPEAEMERDKIKLATLLKIEQTFGSSRKALLNQLVKMKLISKDFVAQNSVNIKMGAKKHGYNLDLYEPNNYKAILGSYGSLANKLYDDDKISEGHFSELLIAIGVEINELNADEKD